MIVKIMDVETGEVKSCVEALGECFNEFIWTDGNYSCDCNRVLCFKPNHPDSAPCESKRYVVVDIGGDTNPERLDEFNSGYPLDVRMEAYGKYKNRPA